jgi:hypothetical protein
VIPWSFPRVIEIPTKKTEAEESDVKEKDDSKEKKKT